MAKKKGNNKRVGGTWEREFSRILSKWISGQDQELICYRASHSGSISTNALKKGKIVRETGDFRAVDPQYAAWFNTLHVDAKSMKDVDLWISESNMKSNRLYLEWENTVSQARDHGKIPMMPVQWRKARRRFMVVGADTSPTYKSCLTYDIGRSNGGTIFNIIDLDNYLEFNDADVLFKKAKRLLGVAE